MSPTNLESHLDALASQIADIQQGEIAEPNTWIERFSVTKSNGKRYVYFRLMSATTKHSKSGKIQGRFKCYLGSAESAKYQAAKAAIERRNHLHHLQKQYQCLLMAQKQTGDKPSSVSGGGAEDKKVNFRPPLTSSHSGSDSLAAEGGHSQALARTSHGLEETSRPVSSLKARERVTQLQQQLQAMSEQYEALVAVFQQQQLRTDVRLREIEGLLARERDSR